MYFFISFYFPTFCRVLLPCRYFSYHTSDTLFYINHTENEKLFSRFVHKNFGFLRKFISRKKENYVKHIISFYETIFFITICVFWDGWLSDVTAENAIIVSIFLCVFFSSFLNSEVILRTKQFI